MPKFRAWDKKEKSMWHVRALLLDQQVAWLVEFGEEGENEQAYPCSFENCHLMQSTGLKGKDDVEIYEGDIVETPSSKAKYLVDYVEGSLVGRIDYREYITLYKGLKVIGNIYENSELLED